MERRKFQRTNFKIDHYKKHLKITLRVNKFWSSRPSTLYCAFSWYCSFTSNVTKSYVKFWRVSNSHKNRNRMGLSKNYSQEVKYRKMKAIIAKYRSKLYQTIFKPLTLIRFSWTLTRPNCLFKKQILTKTMWTSCLPIILISSLMKTVCKFCVSYFRGEKSPNKCLNKFVIKNLNQFPLRTKTLALFAWNNINPKSSLRDANTNFMNNVSACGSREQFKIHRVRFVKQKFVIENYFYHYNF